MKLMRRNLSRLSIYLVMSAVAIAFPLSLYAQKNGVELIRHESEKRVDVIIDGQPFTSYIWPDTLKKPVLYPIRTGRGTFITRKFPLEAAAGESVDHPHQVGMWFNYGDVNGVDFWNNSIYRSAAEAAKMGTILHNRIVKTINGRESGELDIEADWMMPDGKQILRENTKYIFRGGKGVRTIDRVTTLTALNERVVFNDSKEGLFGLRVRRELEQPATGPIKLTGADGKPMSKPVLDNTNVTGEFLGSDGKRGDDVWGTRGNWAMLSGKVEAEDIAIVIFEHPKNPGSPTYWMARGYGLFGANPLGQKAYSIEKKENPVHELNFTLEPKQVATFRFRVFISSKSETPDQIDAERQNFVRQIK